MSTSSIAPSTAFDLSQHTFLVGDEIALRPVTKEDAPYTASWRASRYPLSPETTETWITEQIGKDAGDPYLIVRTSDGRPVGMLHDLGGGFVARSIRIHIDPLFAEHARRWTIAVYRLVVPWLIDERHAPLLRTHLIDDDPALQEALVADGWRETARYPRHRWSSTQATWVDWVALEYLSPHWLDLLGDPAEVPLERTGTGAPRPVPAPIPTPEVIPPQAIAIGERVYLRPLNKDDAMVISELSRQETDTIWSLGRRLQATMGYAGWTERLQEADPPTWIRFAICLRETQEVIGSLGIVDIDYVHGTAETESEIDHVAYRERGYGSEAKQLLIWYAFERLGLHALRSWVIFPNTRSAAALRKQGYREAGRIHWAYSLDGGFGNAVVFTLHADDWRLLPRTTTSVATDGQEESHA